MNGSKLWFSFFFEETTAVNVLLHSFKRIKNYASKIEKNSLALEMRLWIEIALKLKRYSEEKVCALNKKDQVMFHFKAKNANKLDEQD